MNGEPAPSSAPPSPLEATLQFTRNGEPSGKPVPAPREANDVKLVWRRNAITEAWWTKDCQRIGPDIPVPRGANDAHLTLSIPVAAGALTPEQFRSSLPREQLDELLRAVAAAASPPTFEEALRDAQAALLKNLPAERPPELNPRANVGTIARALLGDLAAASHAETTASFPYQEASKLRLVTVGSRYALVNYLPDGPSVLISQQDPSDEDKKIIWYLGFIGEVLVGLLAAAGIKVGKGKNVTTVARILWNNPKVRAAIKNMIAGLTAAAIFEFFKEVYNEGLLDDVLKELADLSLWGVISTAAMLALNLIPGAGQARLLAALALLAVELALKLKDAPK